MTSNTCIKTFFEGHNYSENTVYNSNSNSAIESGASKGKIIDFIAIQASQIQHSKNESTQIQPSKNESKYDIDEIIREREKECRIKYSQLLISTFQNEEVEVGYLSEGQKLYSKIVKEYGHYISALLLNGIYSAHADNEKIISSILYLISNIAQAELSGIEKGILGFALCHKNIEITDLALQCFDKWENSENLELLKSIKIGIAYLDKYREDIIKGLEYVQKQKIC